MWQRIQTVADIAINHILTRKNTKYHEKLLAKFCTKQEFERSTNRSWSISGRHFVHQSTRVWRSPIPVYRRSRRFGGKNNEGLCWLPCFRQNLQTCFRGMPLQWARRRVQSGSLFNAIFLFWRRELLNEGWESGGKGGQKYGRRENVVREAEDSDPLSPPPNSQESSLKDTISSYGPHNSHPLRYITDEKQQKRTGQLVEINICGTVVARILVLDQ